MPFKSEKQRRYLWANEPEIARDWADTYGSRIEKRRGGILGSNAGSMLVTPTRDGTRPGYYGPDWTADTDPRGKSPSNNNQGAQGSDAGWENVQSSESFNPPNLGPDTTTQQIIHGGEKWQGKTTKEVKQAIKERQKTQPKEEINWQNIKETVNPFSRKKYFNWATSLPGSKKRITNYRNKYAEYLKSMGINPSPELLDTDNLYSFFDKQAFEKNLKPTQYGMEAPMSYGDFIAERFGAISCISDSTCSSSFLRKS